MLIARGKRESRLPLCRYGFVTRTLPCSTTYALSNAFTLIELLLVIAIISILAAVGVMTYRQSFQTNRVDTVSIEMQHVLEAAMAFYVDTGAWPTEQPCGSILETNTFVTNYLPNANAMSSLGNQFCWNQAGGSTNRLFWVAVEVPGNATDSLATATRIAGHLPNAIITSAPDQPDIPAAPCTASACFARAEVTVPGTSTNAAGGLTIAATGDCKTGQTVANTGGGVCDGSQSPLTSQTYQISFKACTAGHPILTVAPNFISYPETDGGYFPATSNAYSTGCSNMPDSSGKETCEVTVSVTACTNPHSCVPIDIRNFYQFGDHTTTEGASYLVSCEQSATAAAEGIL